MMVNWLFPEKKVKNKRTCTSQFTVYYPAASNIKKERIHLKSLKEITMTLPRKQLVTLEEILY
jgi:hypothetical protein